MLFFEGAKNIYYELNYEVQIRHPSNFNFTGNCGDSNINQPIIKTLKHCIPDLNTAGWRGA